MVTNFALRGDNPQLIKMIAEKYDLSPEGIIQIRSNTDKNQIGDNLLERIHQKYPKAKWKWNNRDRCHVLDIYINKDLEIFGFGKVEIKVNGYIQIHTVHFKVDNPVNSLL